VIAPLKRAMERSPAALVPRFNLVRVLLHFGGPKDVLRGIALLDDTLAHRVGRWQVDRLDDVLPWDFCSSWFNYRRYFDTVMRSMESAESAAHELTTIILASLAHYRARYANEVPGARSSLEWATEAVRLDPDFAEYVLYCCRLLMARAERADVTDAHRHLERLACRSTRLLEFLDIARYLPLDLQGEWCKELEIRAHRFWSATQVREDLREPALRSSIEAGFRVGPTAPAGEVP
jgi:hypothetical protein